MLQIFSGSVPLHVVAKIRYRRQIEKYCGVVRTNKAYCSEELAEWLSLWESRSTGRSAFRLLKEVVSRA